MSKLYKIPVILLFIIIISCFSAVNAEVPSQNSNNPITPDPMSLYSGNLVVLTSPTTAYVNDTVQIIVTATNNGLVDWSPVSIHIPMPKGLQFVSFEVPSMSLQEYNTTTDIWNLYRMNDFNRASQLTAILNVKVLPEAAGNNLTINANFNQLVLEGYGIDIANQVKAARSTILIILNSKNKNSNATAPTNRNMTPKANANIPSGLYNTNLLVKLSMNEKGKIYYTTNGQIPNNNSQKYTKPLNIKSTTKLKFIAIDKLLSKSPVYTKMYTIDKIPPNVVSSTPQNQHSQFSLTSPITLNFNEKIYKGIQYSKIQVKNMNTHKIVSITETVSGNKLTIKMTRSRLSLNNYQIYIPKGAIKDKAGNNNTPSIIKFKTSRY